VALALVKSARVAAEPDQRREWHGDGGLQRSRIEGASGMEMVLQRSRIEGASGMEMVASGMEMVHLHATRAFDPAPLQPSVTLPAAALQSRWPAPGR
jgi:hypothetical protein